jgi:hypothetical protein
VTIEQDEVYGGLKASGCEEGDGCRVEKYDCWRIEDEECKIKDNNKDKMKLP